MEELINRAAMALGMGVPEAEVVERLKRSDYSDWDIFLAVEAAKINNKHREMIRRFQYWSHKDKTDIPGTLVFECEAESLTQADVCYKEETGQSVERQPQIGVTIGQDNNRA